MRPLPHRPRWLLGLGMLGLVLAGVGAVTTYEDDTGQGTRTGVWVSSPSDPGRRLLPLDDSRSRRPATARVRVDLEDRRQRWRGTGAAMTDASVQLLSEAPDAVRQLFDPKARDGARLSWVRLPLSATDMSPELWTWGWDGSTASPSGQAQAAMAMVAEVTKLQPHLQVVATPWTAPKWMKQPGQVSGGALRDDEVEQYAELLVAQADELGEGGLPLAAMSLGNEPGYSADYPSMTMTGAQQTRLAQLVGPELDERGVELWAVDHNWADRPRYEEVLAGAPEAFDGAAFHCYAGEPGQMEGLAVPPIMTECTGTKSSWTEAFAWDARRLVTESVAAGSTGLLMWNLALDPEGGPRDVASRAGCSSCRGLLTIDGNDVEAGPEFYVLAHLARAADPGARVVGSSASDGISAAAFDNPDGTVGVIAFNGTGKSQVLGVEIRGGSQVRRAVRPGELLTVRVSR